MITCLCYGDSNTWGAIPGPSDVKTGMPGRHPKHQRWPGVLQRELGVDFEVLEEGMNGRTTDLDDQISDRPHVNGLKFLPFCLEAHYPIDWVIFMLGLNDTKARFQRSAADIAEGMRRLIRTVKRGSVLLMAPPPLCKTSEFFPQFDQRSIETSKGLAEEYKKLADEEGVAFLDAGELICTSEVDGLHLEASQCALLGQGVAKFLRTQVA